MGLHAYKFEPVLELDSEDIESSKSRNSCWKQKLVSMWVVQWEWRARKRLFICCREVVDAIKDEKFTGLFILIFFVASVFSCRQNNVNYKVLNFSLPLCSSQLNYLLLLVFIWRYKIISTLLLVSSFSIFSSPYFFCVRKTFH